MILVTSVVLAPRNVKLNCGACSKPWDAVLFLPETRSWVAVESARIEFCWIFHPWRMSGTIWIWNLISQEFFVLTIEICKFSLKAQTSCRVVSTHASFWFVLGSNLIRTFCGFSCFVKAKLGTYLKIGHDCFLKYLFWIVIHGYRLSDNLSNCSFLIWNSTFMIVPAVWTYLANSSVSVAGHVIHWGGLAETACGFVSYS